jgi:hypothetical protein
VPTRNRPKFAAFPRRDLVTGAADGQAGVQAPAGASKSTLGPFGSTWPDNSLDRFGPVEQTPPSALFERVDLRKGGDGDILLRVRLLAVATLLVSCAAPRAQTTISGPLAPVAFIAGHWRSDDGVEEQWTAPSGGMMLGVGRVVKDERVVFFEFLRIESREGKIVYVAQPRGGSATEFTLAKSTVDDVVFENPAHDFPRTIEYRLANGTLTTRVEGIENGKPLTETVSMRRVP